MKSLKELQDEFQRGILAGDDTILAAVNDSAKEQKKILFGVYRNAYVARLAEILGEDYEQVHAYLGDQGFARLVKSLSPPIHRTREAPDAGSGGTFRLTSGAAQLTPSTQRSPSLPSSRNPLPLPSTAPMPNR
jgi:Putative DNA-binding domain